MLRNPSGRPSDCCSVLHLLSSTVLPDIPLWELVTLNQRSNSWTATSKVWRWLVSTFELTWCRVLLYWLKSSVSVICSCAVSAAQVWPCNCFNRDYNAIIGILIRTYFENYQAISPVMCSNIRGSRSSAHGVFVVSADLYAVGATESISRRC